MEKKQIEVECVIDTKMTLILLMDGDVLDEYGGDYGALRDALTGGFCEAFKESVAYNPVNARVDGVSCKVFVKDDIGGGEE